MAARHYAMAIERCTFPLPKRGSGHLGRWSFRSLVYCKVVPKIAFRNTPDAKPDLASQAASKNDTLPTRTIVVPCRLLCRSKLRRLHSGIRFNLRKHEEVHYEKHR
jgi:hypothetical protein